MSYCKPTLTSSVLVQCKYNCQFNELMKSYREPIMHQKVCCALHTHTFSFHSLNNPRAKNASFGISSYHYLCCYTVDITIPILQMGETKFKKSISEMLHTTSYQPGWL